LPTRKGLAPARRNRHRREPATGFSRSAVSDSSGLFRIAGLPVGTYDLKIDLTGFAPSARKVVVNVGATTAPRAASQVAGQAEELTVVADTPLIARAIPGVGEIITSAQIEETALERSPVR